MNFTILFRTKSNFEVCIAKPGRKCGYQDLQDVRRSLNLPSLSIDRVDEDIKELKTSPRLSLEKGDFSENEISAIEEFREKNQIIVYVGNQSLTKYVFESYTYEKNNNGEILRASKEYAYDKKEIFHAWKEAGFPKEWAIDPEGKMDAL